MTSDPAALPLLPSPLELSMELCAELPLELSARDREAAEGVAPGLRDAKAENTRRAYGSAWRRFQAWAVAGGRRPHAPQAVALYLGHLAASGRSIVSID